MRSVPSGTSGVRTVASVQVVGCMSSVLRSVQYCQPAVLSCRNSVMDASGVVVLYHRPRSYCLPGVTTGAQSADSVISALRSPSVRRVSSTLIALSPLRASEVVVNVKSLSPQPDFSQQYCMSPVQAVWRRGFLVRLGAEAAAGAERSRPVVRAQPASRADGLRRARAVARFMTYYSLDDCGEAGTPALRSPRSAGRR